MENTQSKSVSRFRFIDPGVIMGVVVSLIILAVGVFAFFVTIAEVPSTDARTASAINNVSATGDSIFNIIGVVLIIGAIMSIVGLVYGYVR